MLYLLASMVSDITYEILDSLAERYIPKGKHKYLHVDSRTVWIDLMGLMLEKGYLKRKMSVLVKCAMNWEFMLINKFSTLN